MQKERKVSLKTKTFHYRSLRSGESEPEMRGQFSPRGEREPGNNRVE